MSSTRSDSSWPELAGEDEQASLFGYMVERFGIPASAFEDCQLFKHRQSWWLLRKAPSTPLPLQCKVSMVGLKAFQKIGGFVKPTTRLIQVFGPKANKSRLQLDAETLGSLLRKRTIEMDAAGLEDGYVILCHGEYVLGLGLLMGGRLISQIPHKDLPYYCTETCAGCTEICAVHEKPLS